MQDKTKNDLMSNNPDELKQKAFHYNSWQLTERQICDIELLLNGAFAPLTGFLNENDYSSVLQNMRLADGTLWPMPITLDVSESFAGGISICEKITLRDHEGFAIAVLTVSDIYKPDLEQEAQSVFNTLDEAHPAVNYLLHQSNPIYLGGTLAGIVLPIIMIIRISDIHLLN